ncbi:MAG: hypothetical protein M2R45_04912 [Verrucomicrobia subdivision 3 bacterium]|nr:hypothetical protein [Limisphaerales bacterium]MCS1417564.1 hypothetical protein [Limisphaerales bacterium]
MVRNVERRIKKVECLAQDFFAEWEVEIKGDQQRHTKGEQPHQVEPNPCAPCRKLHA